MTGAMKEIDIHTDAGISIREKWQHGPRTYLGIVMAGFPNLFMTPARRAPGSKSQRSWPANSMSTGSPIASSTCAAAGCRGSKRNRSPRMPGSNTTTKSRIARSHQRDVVAIVRLIVVGIENKPLGADRVIVRAQQFRGLRILDGGADFPAHEFGRRFVRLLVDQQIGVRVQKADAAALGPFCLVGLPSAAEATSSGSRQIDSAAFCLLRG